VPKANERAARFFPPIVSIQAMLFLVALGVFAIRWSSGLTTDVPILFADAFLIGNILFFLAQVSAPLYAYRDPP